ncbi:integrase [Colwellia demingiae]|uniref:Integrase n=1 Tax=Colwellia demingiae TaxID=89401 RepID=A0A5C6QJN8_9GAMM|nr:integrase [Colwellia demingiae]
MFFYSKQGLCPQECIAHSYVKSKKKDKEGRIGWTKIQAAKLVIYTTV